jgi:hypothetical protein
MRIVLLIRAFVLILLCGGVALAQSNSTTKPDLPYPLQLSTYNLPGAPGYSISCRVTGYQVFEYTIAKDDDPEKKVTFLARPNGLSTFETGARQAFPKLLKDVEKDSAELARIKSGFDAANLSSIFLLFQGADIMAGSLDVRPKAGEIFFGSKVNPTKYSYTNHGIRAELRSVKQAAAKNQKKQFTQTPKNELDELFEILAKLRGLRDSADLHQLILGKKYLNKQLSLVTDELANALLGINEDNYKEKMRDFRAKWDGKLNTLVSEVEYLLSLGPDRVSIRYMNDTYYITKGIGEPFKTGSKRKAKKTLKRFYQELDNERKGISYNIRSIEAEFDEGYIENIKVIVSSEGVPDIKFENNYPISFSSKKDYLNIQHIYLYGISHKEFYSIRLDEVIERYEQKHEVGRRDYSPSNQVVSFDLIADSKRNYELSKESTAKLFELKTYSDFVGFDQTKPNGLIQFEVEKRLNIIGSRKQFNIFKKNYRSTVGAFQYITPTIVVSKIEQNNKFLILNYKDQYINNVYSPVKYTSTLELKRHENFSVGADLNMFLLDLPSAKSTFYVNTGFRYGRVSIRDSLRSSNDGVSETTGFVNEYGVNTFSVMPLKVVWEVRTDERYSFHLGGSLNLYYLRDNSFIQVANLDTFQSTMNDGDMKYLYKNVFMQLALKPQSDAKGRLFFRYQYNWQQGFWRTGFHQIQLGYSVPLTRELKTISN